MSYVVLARKYRPLTFADLVGQGHVAQTLENAIARDRVAHAFLFTGVRGVGKTTSARILAKALNCEKGPTSNPCLVCDACKQITSGSDIDVQEIDGASYNGVDEVRRLQESLPYRPSRDRFKIFIVDEVHMLSNAAWNAFLKTLEEPPPHVKFIFATTEVQKVPVTILSRCQRYDFKLIGAQEIAATLRKVLEQEGMKAEDGALTIVAREAAGSMRDAMSLLDQVIAWSAGTEEGLTSEGVAKVLGVAARTVLHEIAAALIDGDASKCMEVIDQLANGGYDLIHVARDLLGHLRDVVVAKVVRDPNALLDMPEQEIRDVQALAARADGDDLTRLHLGLSKAFDDIAKGGLPRAALEMTLVRLARRPPLRGVGELLERLSVLEKKLGGGGGGGGSPAGGAPRGGGAEPRGAAPTRSRASGADASAWAPPSGPAVSSQSPSPPSVRTNTASSSSPAAAGSVTPTFDPNPKTPIRRPDSQPDPLPVSTPASASVGGEANGAARRSNDQRPESPQRPDGPGRPIEANGANSSNPSVDGPRSVPPASTRPKSASVAPPVLVTATPEQKARLDEWSKVVELVREQRAALGSVLEHAVVFELGPEKTVLAYDQGSFLAGQVREGATVIEKSIAKVLGQASKLDVQSNDQLRLEPTLAKLSAAERYARVELAKRAIEEHPLVGAAIEHLGATLREVRLPPEMDAGVGRF